jgi:hypothetical protein
VLIAHAKKVTAVRDKQEVALVNVGDPIGFSVLVIPRRGVGSPPPGSTAYTT